MCALVTRPREEAEALAARLTARGIDAMIEPMLSIRFCNGAPLDLAAVQAILCTSGNGVRALARATAERAIPLLAVGEATAARARAAGFSNVERAGGDVADLVRVASLRLRPGDGPLLHAAGSAVAGDIVAALAASGFRVVRQVLYTAEPAAALSPETLRALRAGAIDFALFFSPRTAATFVRLVAAADAQQYCAATASVSISPAVDAALAGLPWRCRLVAARPDQAAVLAAVDRLAEAGG
jgi:uroporphyrinogen-III synthase